MQNNVIAVHLAPVQGERVGYADFVRELASARSLIGKGIASQQGTPNALPQACATIVPLSVATNGTMVITLGGNGEVVACDGFICDGCPSQSFTVPANTSGSVRTDLIEIQYAQPVVSTESEEVESASGVQAAQNVNVVAEGVAYQYVQGDASGNAPMANPGWNAFATITVPSGASSITASDIAYLFPTMNPAGPQGPQGETGPIGLSPTPLGPWSSVAQYGPLDIVTYEGSAWIVNVGQTPTIGVAPVAGTQWTVLVSNGINGTNGTNGTDGTNGVDGAQGQAGQTGPQGPTPWTFTTEPGTVPTVGATGSFSILRSDGLPLGAYVTISDGTNSFYGQISNPGAQLGVTCLAIIAGGAGATLASNALVSPSGMPGATGPRGPQGNQGVAGQTGPQGEQGPQGVPGLGIGTGAAGSSQSAIFTVGVVPLTRRVNYGTQEANKSASSDTTYTGQSGYLGATVMIGVYDEASTIETSCRLQVKSGAGPIAIGGSLIANCPTAVYIDANRVFTSALSSNVQAWSGTIPDDGQIHTVTLHCDNNVRIYAEWGRWIPAGASGGVDANKFTYVGD